MDSRYDPWHLDRRPPPASVAALWDGLLFGVTIVLSLAAFCFCALVRQRMHETHDAFWGPPKNALVRRRRKK